MFQGTLSLSLSTSSSTCNSYDVIHVEPPSEVSISYLTYPLAPVLPSSCENCESVRNPQIRLVDILQRRLDDAQALQGRAGAALGVGSRVKKYTLELPQAGLRYHHGSS